MLMKTSWVLVGIVMLWAAAALSPQAKAQSCPSFPNLDNPCLGIRPGALFHGQDWTDCSAGFVFVDPDGIYLSTAAHCVKEPGQLVWFYHPNETLACNGCTYPEMEARAYDAVVMFQAEEWDLDSDPVQWDVALLRIEPHMHAAVESSMPVWGGPTGIRPHASAPGRVYHYGHDVAFQGTPLEAREGFGPFRDGPLFGIVTSADNGDSGSPVVDEERAAIGYLTNVNVPNATQPGNAVGVSIEHMLEVVKAETGRDLRLVLDGQDPAQELAKIQPLDPMEPRATHSSPGVGLAAAILVMGLAMLVGRKGTKPEARQGRNA
ncbi:MAG: trypsin-like peptidase domain-containing protein [Thermoplasmatota archaeon]